MLGDVLDALAVDPNLASVIETLKELLAGVRQQGVPPADFETPS
jgi:hypothetical protein